MFKRDVSYDGMDCLKDMSQSKYMDAKMQSQSEVPWTDQPKYAKYTVYFGVVIIFLACFKHVWLKVTDRKYIKNRGDRSSNFFESFFHIIVSYFRFFAYKQVPSSVSYFTSLPPSAGSSLFMIVSSFYLFCYCLIPHFWYRGCRGFGSPPLAVRAGVMATALTPFIYVLAGKANMISLVTGISYEKLNSIHQFVGVAAFILSVIHTIPFIYQPLQEGGTANLKAAYNDSFYYMSGIPPLVLLAWLCLASKQWVRKRCYEAFLHLHWLCGIAYFGTLIWHIDQSLDMQDYMWGALAFWATQILYRILVKTAFKPNSLFLRSRKGELKKLTNNSYSVTINNVKDFKWQPGQHCYLRFSGTRILDNHPFSISSIRSDEALTFIIVPRKGLTKKLYNDLNNLAVQNKKVYIDGPYGGVPRNIEAFDKVSMIATGSGVSATIPFLLELSEHIKSKRATGALITKQLDFIWIIREVADVNWIKDQLRRSIELAGSCINIDIYISHGEPESEKLASKEKDFSEDQLESTIETSSSLSSIEGINLHYFKPNVKQLVGQLAPSLQKKNLIISSGSASMRSAVSEVASSFQTRIFNNDLSHDLVEEVCLHTESFGW